MPTEVMSALRMQPHSPVLPIRLLTRGPEYLRRQIETGTPARSSRSAVERLAADKAKYVKSQKAAGSSASESSSSTTGSSTGSQQPPESPARRGSKRLVRPDSLLIYRHKGQAEAARGGLVRRLFLGSAKDKPLLSLAPPRGGLHRSQSDISSRYSRSFSDFDTFFKYCGLEPEVVEELGEERFSGPAEEAQDGPRIRSASVATSDSGFSRRSAASGPEDEPLSGHLPPSTTSVIERNARIIKWLYSCKKAKEARGASPELP